MKTYKRFFLEQNSEFFDVVVAYSHNHFDKAETAAEIELKKKCIEVIDAKAVEALAFENKRLSSSNELLKKALDLCKQQRDLWIDAVANDIENHEAGKRVKANDNKKLDEIMGVKYEFN